MKRFILITLLALTLTSCVTTEKCKGQDNIEWFGVSQPSGYGGLYNWWAASDARGFISGWHVPTSTEWYNLRTYLDPLGSQSSNIAGGKMKEAGLTHWLTPNTDADNSSGFNGVGPGIRTSAFGSIKYNCTFQASTDYSATQFIGGGFLSYSDGVLSGTGGLYSKYKGYSIRLLKDDSTDSGTVTIDGDVYNTVTIGTQVWLARNLKATHYANGDPITNVTDDATWAALTTEAFCWYNNDYTKR